MYYWVFRDFLSTFSTDKSRQMISQIYVIQGGQKNYILMSKDHQKSQVSWEDEKVKSEKRKLLEKH